MVRSPHGAWTLRVRGAGCAASKPSASPAAPHNTSENAVALGLGDFNPVVQDLDSTTVAQESHDEILGELRLLDDGLITTLQCGDIRLVRTSWLVVWASAAEDGRLLPSRQELEALEAAADYGSEGTPLLQPDEAVALIRCADRRVAVLSHGWLTAAHCDPDGARLAVMVRALKQFAQLKGLFWDYASMYQKPRTDAQADTFGRAITVMGDLCTRLLNGLERVAASDTPPSPRLLRTLDGLTDFPSALLGCPLCAHRCLGGRYHRAAAQGDPDAPLEVCQRAFSPSECSRDRLRS